MTAYVGDKTLPVRRQIRFKLVAAFLVPILFIVALGVYSYVEAKSTVVNNYERSTMSSIDSSAMYLGLLMSDSEAKASQIANDTNFTLYYNLFDTNSVMDSNTYFTNAKATLNTLVSSSVGVYAAQAFGKSGNVMSTLYANASATTYSNFIASEEYTILSESQGNMVWTGYHKSVDSSTGSTSDFYCATFIRKFAKGEGYITFDLLTSKVQEVLSNTIISDRSIVGFITSDGRETIAAGKKEKLSNLEEGQTVFAGSDFLGKVDENESGNGYEYVRYDGEKYLFVYSKIEDTGATIAILIPQNEILSEVRAIRLATILFVLVGCVVVVFIGLVMAAKIGNNLASFSSSFRQVAEGDLTVKINIHEKDEFGVLADHANHMIQTIHGLVDNMAGFGHDVTVSSTQVSEGSGAILTSIREISSAVGDMEDGVNNQATYTSKSYERMTEFAEQIGVAGESTQQIGHVADDTRKIVDDGRAIVGQLQEQSLATATITNVILKDIQELEKQSQDIGGIVETINSIAAKTNLLSLNASIEAARAGVAGRGFTVVAQEIRSLAEQSMQAVHTIKGIIENIQTQTQTTATSAGKAETMLVAQKEALRNTVEVFEDVDRHMDELIEQIGSVKANMESIAVSKDEVLDSIRNITEISSQTAKASDKVVKNVDTQISSVDKLNARAEELMKKAKELEDAIQTFQM